MRTINMSVKDCMETKGQDELSLVHAIYIISNNNDIEYIGCTMRPVSQRMREHVKNVKAFLNCNVEIRQYDIRDTSVRELRRLEAALIDEYNPIYNFRRKSR